MDYKIAYREIVNFLREETECVDGVILGLSGGIDSALVAYIAVDALGKERVKTQGLPYGEQNTRDGDKIAEILGTEHINIDIKPRVDSLIKTFESLDGKKLEELVNGKLVHGNLRARERMCCLYTQANRDNLMVLGTTNKSEYEIGYFTKHGDGAADLELIQDLYKTEVWELAKYRNLPKWIIKKTPSAELWEGQTDEREIGVPYKILDQILKGEIEGIDPEKVKIIKRRVLAAAHKKNPPKYPKLRYFLDNLHPPIPDITLEYK